MGSGNNQAYMEPLNMSIEKKFKSICIFADGYPTQDDPQFAFIRPVVCEMADQGIKCTVIVPQSITRILIGKVKARKRQWNDLSRKGNAIKILQPYTVTLSHFVSTHKITEFVCKRTFKQNRVNTDILYGHFWKNGIMAARISCEHGNIPVIVVSGEANVETEILYNRKDIENRLGQLNGLICVSSRNLDEGKRLNLVDEKTKVTILPNAYDKRCFYKIDKDEARRKLGLGSSDFIGIAVGEYSYRKGTERIIEAAKSIPELRLILIGDGDTLSDMSQVLISGAQPHDKLVLYLNAADFFILPTLAEGCCNAIVEALACGLPVVSSDLPFNDELLNESNSIRIDPLNVQEIVQAITLLKNNQDIRRKLASGALKSSSTLSIEERTKKIIDFINCVLNNK